VTFDSSVTHWITELRGGDAEAAQRLWERYFHRLVGLARGHLGLATRGGADSEDVAQSVFKSLCIRAELGQYQHVTDRDNFWTLLVAMTIYKSRDLLRRERSLKRGGGRVLSEASLTQDNESPAPLDEVIGSDPTPDFVVQVAEECEALLSQLNENERQTAELKLQGYSNEEIAKQMGCAVRTVERRLGAIRRAWGQC
jgi:RNA polymerase sigma factor (sigma-70 family)